MRVDRAIAIVIPVFALFLSGLMAASNMNYSGAQTFTGGYNETQTSYPFGAIAFTFTTVIIIISVAVAAAILMGITVFGSGVSGVSIKIVFAALIFLTLWAALSLFGAGFIIDIPYAGIPIYFILTVIYCSGAVTYMTGGGEG